MMPMWQLATATLVVVLAIGISVYPSLFAGEEEEDTIYVIGDLHGDVECAKHWVEVIGLVDNIEDPQRWVQKKASLVFMGDYIDKGPYSYQTLRFVQTLTDRFPDQVTALMGNHEMELLKDRDPRRPVGYYQLPYASVHPGEYFNFLERELDETDEFVLDLLLNASLEVYAGGHYRSVMYAPEIKRHGHHVVSELMPESVRPLVNERLREYQRDYIRAFLSNTTLGQWVEARPVAHIQNGFFFTHGGISRTVASALTNVERVDKLNKEALANSGDADWLYFIEQTEAGNLVSDLLLHRGNHKGDNACMELRSMMNEMDGVERLVVGHTPGKDVRIACDGRFLAVDSLLGRYIRTSGNHYCPDQGRQSRDGTFVCQPLTATCEGQIVKITGTDVVEVLYSGQETTATA